MLPGVVLLALAALMLYQGFTGNSAIGEIQKMISGEPAFSTKGQPLAEAVSGSDDGRSSGGGVRTGNDEDGRISGGGVRTGNDDRGIDPNRGGPR